MARFRHRTLSSRTVERLKAERDTVFWDRELQGFGVRVYPSGGKVYVAQARGPQGPKRVTVGRHGVLNAEQARQRAALIIARVKAGETPVPEPMAARHTQGPTVADLAEAVSRRVRGGALQARHPGVDPHGGAAVHRAGVRQART